jgi:hypothetical protein
MAGILTNTYLKPGVSGIMPAIGDRVAAAYGGGHGLLLLIEK